jgi:hypothetical protein
MQTHIENIKEHFLFMASLHPLPQDNKAYRFPVSVRGIVYHNGKVVLLKNERNEWELPGGKLELGESPEATVVREIEEEPGLEAQTGPLLDSWVYRIFDGVDALILIYGCYLTPNVEQSGISSEGEEKRQKVCQCQPLKCHRSIGHCTGFALNQINYLELKKKGPACRSEIYIKTYICFFLKRWKERHAPGKRLYGVHQFKSKGKTIGKL